MLYVYIYIYIHTYIHIQVYKYIYINVYMYMYVCICICSYVHKIGTESSCVLAGTLHAQLIQENRNVGSRIPIIRTLVRYYTTSLNKLLSPKPPPVEPFDHRGASRKRRHSRTSVSASTSPGGCLEFLGIEQKDRV